MRKSIRIALVIFSGLAPVAIIAAARTALGAPLILYNPSLSEPLGFYRLSAAPPDRGKIIAFRVPAPGRDYVTQRLPSVARSAVLKEVAAGQGAVVCGQAGMVFIDGIARGKVSATDRQGVPLPHWSGCRRLQAGQYFVLSNRIPNSFDSRYYGPVSEAELVGVYQPLWTE